MSQNPLLFLKLFLITGIFFNQIQSDSMFFNGHIFENIIKNLYISIESAVHHVSIEYKWVFELGLLVLPGDPRKSSDVSWGLETERMSQNAWSFDI